MNSAYSELANGLNNPDKYLPKIISAFTICIAIMIAAYYAYVFSGQSRQCSAMDDKYGAINGSLRSITSTDPDCGYRLADYYINTAYNCCSGGNYRNDFVNSCNLRAVIRQGVRCLDFEIYLVNGVPVVATSTVDDYFVKETYNYVEFSEAMRIVDSMAFNGSSCPNPGDPMLIHLRVKSSSDAAYAKMADVFAQYSGRMLGKAYSFENHNKNVGDLPVLTFAGKYIVMVDRENLGYLQNQHFLEYVNMTSGSMFLRKYTYDEVKHNADPGELTNFNRKHMTLVTPDRGGSPENPSSLLCRTYGCQLIAMRYQTADNFLKINTKLFNASGYAFSLKPESLRYTPITIPEPTPQNPELSYATQTVATDYYSFDV